MAQEIEALGSELEHLSSAAQEASQKTSEMNVRARQLSEQISNIQNAEFDKKEEKKR